MDKFNQHIVESFYKKNSITHPEQLDLMDIAEKLDIWVYFWQQDSLVIKKGGCTVWQ